MTLCRPVLALVVAALTCLAFDSLEAGQQDPHTPQAVVRALRVTEPPTIDGHLSEEAWTRAEPATNLTQRDPDEGRPSTERSEFRILFDDRALYIGARLFDHDPQRIVKRLSGRDVDPDADSLTVVLDPLHDHFTGMQFRLSAAGVQWDSVISNDTWSDNSWDAVWNSAVSIDDQGWSAEMRIPLSQLRFAPGAQQVWGINVSRYIHRLNETSWLELVPKNENGLASRMAHLAGLDGIVPKRHLALLPYVAARSEFIQPVRAGDPFNDGSRMFGAAGLDLKWGVTSSLTLDGTINPDFGQVEVDPAVVNLTAFETFFNEKRPFFIEGAQIFNTFGQGGATDFWGFNTSDPQIFYSRRIGRSPQVLPAAQFLDPPAATTILGAVKLTGKTRNGWSIGLLEALTDGETARVENDRSRGRIEVEPRTNYLVGRMKRDFGQRASVGMLTTAVLRHLDSPLVRAALADRAFVFGGDGYWFLDDKREWVITGKLSGSHFSGTDAFLVKAQLAPQRYYQRPDAPQVTFDPTRTMLRGMAGRVNLNRNSGNLKVNAAFWSVSPGFESNDLGFHTTGDRAGAHGVLLWSKTSTDRFTRYRHIWVGKWWNWNFDQQLQGDGWHVATHLAFLNYSSLNTNAGLQRRVQDDRLTRGGPSAAAPGGGFWNFNLSTDSRKSAWVQLSGGSNWSEFGDWGGNGSVTINLKPFSMLTLSSGPELNRSRALAQYVRTVVDATAVNTYGGRYVFGIIDQEQLTLTTRASIVLSPRVGIQIFAQPLVAVGKYPEFRELARPRTFDFVEYGSPGTSLTYDALARRYTVDPDDTGPAAPFGFDNPDFNFKSLRFNAVFRWEIKPGSTFYAVWTRQHQDLDDPGVFRAGQDLRALFSAPSDDVFLVKMAYWIGR
ncbi:MAG: DUF5916 domain-containing protein [Vicinamibacterales bacterium]